MKGKMWCLINKNTNKIIKIADSDSSFIVGLDTKKGLLETLAVVSEKELEFDETIRKIEFEY